MQITGTARRAALLHILPSVSLALICAGAAALLSNQADSFGNESELGALSLPRAILWVIAGVSLAEVLLSRFRTPEIEPTPPLLGRVIMMIIALIFVSAILPIAGYLISAFLAFCGCAWSLGYRKPLRMVASGILTAAVTWVVFSKLIDLSLPGMALMGR